MVIAYVEYSIFHVPSTVTVAGLRPGDYVKVGVNFAPVEGCDGERFWVEITKRDGDAFHGLVRNELVFTEQHGLDSGQPIEFEARHVLGGLRE